MEEPLTELDRISNGLDGTRPGDFQSLRKLLQQRAQVLNQIEAMPPSHSVYLALQQASEDSSRLHILIQVERRRLCLEAATLRNQQRLVEEMRNSRSAQNC